MPVVRSCVQCASPQNSSSQFADYGDQTTQASKNVKGVNDGEYIKERTTWIGAKIPALRPQLKPRCILASNKEHAKKKSDVQPTSRIPGGGSCGAHVACDLSAGQFQGHAACQQNHRVQIKNVRQSQMPPIQRSSLTDDHGAGEGSKRHCDRR